MEPVLKEGETCWRKVRAEKATFIVDAAQYFAAAKETILAARHCVYLIGWEFDFDIRLRPDVDDPEVPDNLRQFLQHVAEQRPELEIFVLQWDGAMLLNIAKQIGSYLKLKAAAKPQIHFRLDSKHPPGACHHQKIVVIDDQLAFCGGIDMTSGRWDTSSHREDRDGAGDGPAMPWHDMTLALEGEAARILGELARWRWKNATGEDLPVPSREDSIWPISLEADLHGVEVGIARTCPAYGDNPKIDEIEKLWCAAIRSAKRSIYIENQFLSSGTISEVLKEKLEEEDGPQIVIILPSSSESWLESEAMDSQRSLILSELRAADAGRRLGVYFPVNAAGEPIYVHAKLLLVDDRLVRIGSSNMASRSFAADTECDLAMETVGQPELSEVICSLRTRLLAEHLGLSTSEIDKLVGKDGEGIHAAVEQLRREHGRTLRKLEGQQLTEAEKALAKSRLLDPEEPISASRRIGDFAKEALSRKPVIAGGLLAAGLIGWWVVRRR